MTDDTRRTEPGLGLWFRAAQALAATLLVAHTTAVAAQDEAAPAADEAPVEETPPAVDDAPPADGDDEADPETRPVEDAPVEVEAPPPAAEAPATIGEPPAEHVEPPASASGTPAPEDEETPPPPPKEKPKAVAIGSFLQMGVGPAWNVSAPEFDRYRDELFDGEEAAGRVTWGRFAWAVEDTPAYFQAGVMRTGGALSEGYDGVDGGETFKVSVRALSVDLGVGAQWTAPRVNPFSFYGDAALVVISADTVAESGAGTQRNEDTNVAMLLRGGVRVAIYGPLAADVVVHFGGMMDRAVTGGLSYVF